MYIPILDLTQKNPRIMSYRLKSLIYLAAFVLSAIIYNATSPEEAAVVVQEPEAINKSISDNSRMDVQNEAELLDEVALKN